jgi:hypothetical protein
MIRSATPRHMLEKQLLTVDEMPVKDFGHLARAVAGYLRCEP